jgi:membrane protease YdiL (CAAX protease family)
MLVGFAEEWMYRGLLLVVLTRLLGFRQGVLASAGAFGLLHALNILAGQSAGAVIGQVLLTTMFAFMFIGLVLATRSLWIAMALHGLYDFFLFSNTILTGAGAKVSLLSNVGVFALTIVSIAVAVSILRSPVSRSTEIYSQAE